MWWRLLFDGTCREGVAWVQFVLLHVFPVHWTCRGGIARVKFMFFHVLLHPFIGLAWVFPAAS